MSYTKAQQQLIDNHRDWNVSDEWWSFTYEYWDQKLTALGIDLTDKGHKQKYRTPAIYFSGFCSQGDGACFDGDINFPVFIKEHNLGETYPGVLYFTDQINASVIQSGHYSRSGCTSFDFNDTINTDDSEPLRQAINENMMKVFQEEWDGFQEAVVEICRGYMDDIYHDLEEEYDYLTSDDAIWESLKANGVVSDELPQIEADLWGGDRDEWPETVGGYLAAAKQQGILDLTCN